MTGLVLANDQLRMNATCPVQLEMHRGRIVRCICHDFFKDRPKDAFLQAGRRVGLIPQPLQIISKRKQLFPLSRSQLRCSDGRFFQAALHLGNMFQSVVSALLQLGCDKPVLRFGGLILSLDAAGFIMCLLNRKFKRAPLFIHSSASFCWDQGAGYASRCYCVDLSLGRRFGCRLERNLANLGH
jgi:hypothetical protein